MFLILSLSKDAQPNCSAVQAHARSIDIARQHLALADMIGGADDALGLHALDDARGAVVADLQVALHETGRRLALAAPAPRPGRRARRPSRPRPRRRAAPRPLPRRPR